MKLLKLGILAGLLLAWLGLPISALADTGCEGTYQIARRDTLSKIATRCGTTISALMMANPQIKNPNKIYRGAILNIPRNPEQVGDSLTLVHRPVEDRLSRARMAKLGIDEESLERWIDVDLSSQTVSAYRGQEVVRTFLVSTGTWRTPTVTGQYHIYARYKEDDMRGPGYFLRDVPYTMYFHKGYALHGTYWHDNFGRPMSHGCVNLNTEDAAWLYDFASLGTMVNVHH